jgi:hypothetical protein
MKAEVKVYCDIDDIDGFFRKDICLPFAPMQGLELMIGESSDWNHLKIESVLWNIDSQSFSLDCDWVALRDLNFQTLHKFMTSNGFVWDGDLIQSELTTPDHA